MQVFDGCQLCEKIEPSSAAGGACAFEALVEYDMLSLTVHRLPSWPIVSCHQDLCTFPKVGYGLTIVGVTYFHAVVRNGEIKRLVIVAPKDVSHIVVSGQRFYSLIVVSIGMIHADAVEIVGHFIIQLEIGLESWQHIVFSTAVHDEELSLVGIRECHRHVAAIE